MIQRLLNRYFLFRRGIYHRYVKSPVFISTRIRKIFSLIKRSSLLTKFPVCLRHLTLPFWLCNETSFVETSRVARGCEDLLHHLKGQYTFIFFLLSTNLIKECKNRTTKKLMIPCFFVQLRRKL